MESREIKQRNKKLNKPNPRNMTAKLRREGRWDSNKGERGTNGL